MTRTRRSDNFCTCWRTTVQETGGNRVLSAENGTIVLLFHASREVHQRRGFNPKFPHQRHGSRIRLLAQLSDDCVCWKHRVTQWGKSLLLATPCKANNQSNCVDPSILKKCIYFFVRLTKMEEKWHSWKLCVWSHAICILRHAEVQNMGKGMKMYTDICCVSFITADWPLQQKIVFKFFSDTHTHSESEYERETS